MDAAPSSTETGGAALNSQVTGRRIVAALIDMVPLGILFLAMAATMGNVGSSGDSGFRVTLSNGPFVLYMLLSLGYFIGMEGLLGATAGKMVMGLKVVKLDGSPVGIPAVLARNVLRVVDGLPFFYIVGLVFVAVTNKNQRLGDLAAGTTVVRA